MTKKSLDTITNNLRAIQANLDNIYKILAICIEEGQITLDEDNLSKSFDQSKKGEPN